MRYVELHCKSNFSFLEGASYADELLQQAAELGYAGLAITDRNSLAGIVRAHTASKDATIPLIVGAELHPIDGPPLVVWPSNREAYQRLCRLITRGRLRREKGSCDIYWSDIIELNEGLLAGLLLRKPVIDELPPADVQYFQDELAFPWESQDSSGNPSATETKNLSETPSPPVPLPASGTRGAGFRIGSKPGSGQTGTAAAAVLGAGIPTPVTASGLPGTDFDPRDDAGWLHWLGLFRDVFSDRGYLLAELHRGVDDHAKLQRMAALSDRARVPLVAAGDVAYHSAERSLLHDCLLATRFATTIDQIANERTGNSQHHLRSLQQLKLLFEQTPDAIERSVEIAERINFSLDELRYQYPVELAPEGQKPIDFLKRLTWNGAKRRYPQGVPAKILELLKHEVGLIEELGYEAYFLTVWDLVRFARSRGILCQGRGSAANSVVCYCLEVTSVDPNRMDLLFERFISRERNEAPDIDIDFEHQRREEVLQYIYEKYGRHRTGMTATVITYRIKSAIRDCGRALGISLDRIDALSKLIDARLAEGTLADRAQSAAYRRTPRLEKGFCTWSKI